MKDYVPTPAEHLTPRTYTVRHATTYTYEEPLESSLSRAMLRPRNTNHQCVVEHEVEISPAAFACDEHIDIFGNYSHYVEVEGEIPVLSVVKTSVVEVEYPAIDLEALNRWTVASAASALGEADVDPFERELYLAPSAHTPLTAKAREFAADMWPDDMPFGEALFVLYHRIYGEFPYRSGVTTVNTTLDELLEIRAGVCQDFAHLAVAVARAKGIPARYVSGYIETTPPPGKEKLEGSDASHAWVAVLSPSGDWIELDPTNDHLADSRYIVNAWGRDFADVSPLKGVIFGEPGSSKLDVAVDVRRHES